MTFTFKEILESSRERQWRNDGVAQEDVAFSRLSGIDARDVAAFRSFTRRDLLIVVRCPKRDARLWHGVIAPKTAATASKTGDFGVGDRTMSDGRKVLFVSDYDLMSVWRHESRSFRKVFVSAAGGAKRGAWPPEAISVIHALNQLLVSRIQHGCQDDYQSSANQGLKKDDHFAAFRLGKARYLPTYRDCARYYEEVGLSPWPYADDDGKYIGPKLD